MRTTLDIDDDVLLAAKESARRDKRSVGQVISELARGSLQRRSRDSEPRRTAKRSALEKLGIRPLPKRGGVVTNETINKLRDDGIY